MKSARAQMLHYHAPIDGEYITVSSEHTKKLHLHSRCYAINPDTTCIHLYAGCFRVWTVEEKKSFELQLNQNESNAAWVEVEVEIHEKNRTNGKTNIPALREHKFSNAMD